MPVIIKIMALKSILSRKQMIRRNRDNNFRRPVRLHGCLNAIISSLQLITIFPCRAMHITIVLEALAMGHLGIDVRCMLYYVVPADRPDNDMQLVLSLISGKPCLNAPMSDFP
jgi:hypothetical protein